MATRIEQCRVGRRKHDLEGLMRRISILIVVAGIVTLVSQTSVAALTPKVVPSTNFGTVDGNVTTQGGQPLNGVCLHLYNAKYTKDKIDFAASGTTGTTGFFTQGSIPVGHYLGLFFNCGANTGGSPDPNYVNIFYGGTFNPAKAFLITVSSGQTTNLGITLIPLGGTVTGTVTDTTANMPAWPLVVQAEIPKAHQYNAFQTILTVCAGTDGSYSISGVPTTGVKIVFAPANWSCPDGGGTFVSPFNEAKYPGLVSAPSDGTISAINGSVTENGSPF
jgi:hypothetical protein